MKKAKIMLIAIAVLATVGGALAFKAQKFVATKYCTTDSNPNPTTAKNCKLFITSITTDVQPDPGADFTVWYETTDTDCGTGIKCIATSTSFVSE